MSNYYKNSDKDISQQIYLTNNINVKNSFRPIFDAAASYNAGYAGLNNVNINEKINTTNYLYNNVDICNNCFAVFTEYTSSATSVSVPTWCSKIRAVLIGGGGGGCSSSNNYSSSTNIIYGSSNVTNWEMTNHFNKQGTHLSFDKNIASYQQQSGNFFSKNTSHTYFKLFEQFTLEQRKYYLEPPGEAALYYNYAYVNNNTWTASYDFDYDDVNSDHVHNNKQQVDIIHNNHIHYKYNPYNSNTTITNTINPTTNSGGGGGGGGFLYLKDYTANQTMSVTIGGGGAANSDGGGTSIVVGTTTVGTAPGGSGTTTSTGGGGGGTATDDTTKKIVSGSSGASSTDGNGGAGGAAGLSITNGYGNGGAGGARATTGSSVSNAGGAGTQGYCRIYFLAN